MRALLFACSNAATSSGMFSFFFLAVVLIASSFSASGRLVVEAAAGASAHTRMRFLTTPSYLLFLAAATAVSNNEDNGKDSHHPIMLDEDNIQTEDDTTSVVLGFGSPRRTESIYSDCGGGDDKGSSMKIRIDMKTGATQIYSTVDESRGDDYEYDDSRNSIKGEGKEQVWFDFAGRIDVYGWDPLTLISSSIESDLHHEEYGGYTNITFLWIEEDNRSSNNGHGTVTSARGPDEDSSAGASKNDGHENNAAIEYDRTRHKIQLTFSVFEEREMILFDQLWINGWENPMTSSAVTPSFTTPTNPITPPSVVAGFPSIQMATNKLVSSTKTQISKDLNYLLWGGCFASAAQSGNWTELKNRHGTDIDFKKTKDWVTMFNGDDHGQPLVLHDDLGRSMVMSSFSNYMISGFASSPQNETIQIGLRTTLNSIPSNFSHSSILVAGRGINSTMMEWGDILLRQPSHQKQRAHAYDDFLLAHLGYWTDSGAYHYTGAHVNYKNMEEALLDVKKSLLQDNSIPIRYVQWDDWWMESKGDIPGILSWTPKSDVFPSGFSDWLGIPLAMYAPEYSSENIWVDDYEWIKVQTKRGPTAIPLDPNFYNNLFQNGTRIGMIHFEQDFLCKEGIGSTGLTNSDISSGTRWLSLMNDAASAAGIKLQYCMPNAYHILQSTVFDSVTNARATDDNTRNWKSIPSMGQNGLLFYSLGLFASRDNVWTSNADVEQPGCGNSKFCYVPNAHLDNAIAVLSGGPYGIADAAGYTNKSLVLYACRTDGLMLRPRWPLTSLDFTFTDKDAKGSLIWAAHDDFSLRVHGDSHLFRWSYIVGVDLDEEVDITPRRLLQGQKSCFCCDEMVAWEVIVGASAMSIYRFSDSSPLLLPRSKPLNLPYAVPHNTHTHFATAPILPNGMVLLGEVNKWATMSFGRILDLQVFESDPLTIVADVVGAPSEKVVMTFMVDAKESVASDVVHTFPSKCPKSDKFGNTMCQATLACNPNIGCHFSPVDDDTSKKSNESSRLRTASKAVNYKD